MLYLQPPEDFKSKFKIAICFLDYNGKILLVHRNDRKMEGDTWALPGGGIERGETPIMAMQRELKEETGLMIPADEIRPLKITYVRFPNYDFESHLFIHRLIHEPAIVINPREHKAFEWRPPQQALTLKLIMDGDATIQQYVNYKNK